MRALRLPVLAAVAAAALLAGCGRRPSPRPYNVVLISIDTLRADHLNIYGYRARKVSPHIDALARDGIVFDQHVSASPWTTPSHMSLLTGLSPSRHGVTTSFRQLMSQLRSGGAFERLADSHLTLAEALAAKGYATAAFTGGTTLSPAIGFGQGFEQYDVSMSKLSPRALPPVYDWIGKNKGRPFFLFFHTFEVHAPYLRWNFLDDVLPPERMQPLARAIRGLGRDPASVATTDLSDLLDAHHAYTLEVCTALYDGGVASVDAYVGKLVAWLKEQGLYDRTLIVLTSDHGEQLGERMEGVSEQTRGRGIYNTHGHTLYEELIRIPLVVKLPDQARAGTRVTTVSREIDVMPTILDLLEAAPAQGGMEGTSLRPDWERPGAAPARMALSEALSEAHEKKGLRAGRYEYILSVSSADVAAHGRSSLPARPLATELYDLVADPGERRDLIARPLPALPADLPARLDATLRAVVGTVAPTVGRGAPISPEDLEKLRALGYVN